MTVELGRRPRETCSISSPSDAGANGQGGGKLRLVYAPTKLPGRLHRRIQQVAHERGTTVSAVIREALEELYADVRNDARTSTGAHVGTASGERMLARGAKRLEFQLAGHEVRRTDAHAAKLGLKRAAAISDLVLHGLDVVEQRDGIPAAKVDDVVAVLETLETLVAAVGPAVFGTQRLLAYWVAKAAAGKISEEELLDESRAAGREDWEQIHDELRPGTGRGE
jgi:predicted transcriptional regulator